MTPAALLVALAAAAPGAAPDREGIAFFETHVRPILVEHCHACHSQEAGKRKGGLLLDSAPGWQAGGESGPAIVPGDPDRSLLVKAVRYTDPTLEMPPQGRLPDKQVQLLERWIQMDAPDPRTQATAPAPAAPPDPEAARRHWAFQPLARPPSPPVRDVTWGRNAVDGFVRAAQEARGLAPSPEADRRRLIRRVSFDVTGLPPTPEEIRAFEADPAPDAYERLVDRLLASPRFGERWARHWLDVARFAESHGFEQDTDRPHAYHYRDFVVRAFNDDLPYDTFVAWQLAGDELAPDEPPALMATGFLGAGPFPTQLTEAEFESARYDEIDDMVSTVGVAFLGLTVGCARCHDHKFDPISARDYYRMAAAFTTTVRARVDLDLGPEAHRLAADRHEQTLARLVAERDRLRPGSPERKDLERQVKEHRAHEPRPGLTPVMISTEGLKPLPHLADDRGFPHFYPALHVLRRGDVRQKIGVATPGMLPVLLRAAEGDERWQRPAPAGARTSFRRAALARWIVDVEHGAGALAARVMVNRIWQHYFGRGLVQTPNDFGRQGAAPTHPELLEHLAGALVAGGWRLKPIHRLILTSATYRQSASPRPEARRLDPDEILLWRRTPRRLEAEAIRDAMLAVSGRLDQRMYGPGTLDEGHERRSLYFTVKRSQLVPSLQLFDAPDALVSLGGRARTTVAPQALAFLNGPQTRRHAEGLAARLAPVVRRSRAEAVRLGFELAFGRPPAPAELSHSLGFIAAQAASHRGRSAAERTRRALTDFAQTLLAANEFIHVE